MTDTITILTSATDNYLSKAFSGEQYDPCDFKPGSTFTTSDISVVDLQGLAAVLRSLEAEPTKTISRGPPITDATEVVSRTKEQFRSTKRQWCMIDIDSLDWDGDIHDQGAILSYAIQQLPVEFQAVYCWYHFSSSIGIKSGIRVHLWFWLDCP